MITREVLSRLICFWNAFRFFFLVRRKLNYHYNQYNLCRNIKFFNLLFYNIFFTYETICYEIKTCWFFFILQIFGFTATSGNFFTSTKNFQVEANWSHFFLLFMYFFFHTKNNLLPDFRSCYSGGPFHFLKFWINFSGFWVIQKIIYILDELSIFRKYLLFNLQLFQGGWMGKFSRYILRSMVFAQKLGKFNSHG